MNTLEEIQIIYVYKNMIDLMNVQSEKIKYQTATQWMNTMRAKLEMLLWGGYQMNQLT